MKAFVLALLLTPTAASAIELPKGRPEDPRVCDVVYDPNNVVQVVATVGENVTIKFGDDEVIEKKGLAVSDASPEHLARTAPDPSNLLYLKAKIKMDPQPIAVRTFKKADGTPRDYQIEWSAVETPPPINVASTDAKSAVPPPTCYMVRYQYPSDVKAAANAKAVAAWRKRKEEDAEIALHKATVVQKLNVKYVMQGDPALAPANQEIWDDGNTMEMRFANRVPAFYTTNPDGTERLLCPGQCTIADNGDVQIHTVVSLLRLRDGDQVLCIFYRGPSAIYPSNTDPHTGTVSPDFKRGTKYDKP